MNLQNTLVCRASNEDGNGASTEDGHGTGAADAAATYAIPQKLNATPMKREVLAS